MAINFVEAFDFEESYQFEDHESFWFKGDKSIINELFPTNYPEATSTELEINKYTDGEITVEIGPCLENEAESTVYDWNGIDLDAGSIDMLLMKATCQRNINPERMGMPDIDIDVDIKKETNVPEISDSMIEALKIELFMRGADVIEDFIGHDLDFNDNDVLDNYMDEVIEQMPDEEFMKYYEKYVTETPSNEAEEDGIEL